MKSEMTDWHNRLDLPKMALCTQAVNANDAVIIGAAGFEDRTLAFSASLTARNCRVALLVYKDWESNNREEDLITAYIAGGIRRQDIGLFEYDRFDPDRFSNALELWLDRVPQLKVIVDISTMSRLAIMIVLDVCRASGKEVSLHYAEAREYGPSKKEYENARKGLYPRPSVQVYSGVGGVVRSSRLSSVALQGEPTALVAFMSMNEVLTQALINSISPSRLLMINGRPPHHSWREEATAWIHEELRREWSHEDNPVSAEPGGRTLPCRVTSTLEYQETVNVLFDLYWKFSAEFRIVLAPTGSKMQSVASFIVKAVHTDIHVEYPTPESFLKEYSRGIGDRWLIEFGNLGRRVQSWRSLSMDEELMVCGGGLV